MTRTIPIPIVLALVFSIFACELIAEDVQPPRFLIERIEVRNNRRVSSQIIVSESLLREGVEYSESELADANARLTRLPFLLTAELALERGSERGAHVLVISVTETRPFFYNLDSRPVFRTDDHGHDSIGSPLALNGVDANAALGFRFFVGRRGAVHFGLTGSGDNRDYTIDDGGFAIGYTQYDVFGTRAFVTVNLKHNFEKWSPQLVTGMPLSVNQNLTFSYNETRFDGGTVRFADQELENEDSQRLITLRWSYNTTNDPFVPTAGTLIHVTPVAVWRDEVKFFYGPALGTEDDLAYIAHLRAFGVDFGGSHYWELSELDSVSVGLEVGTARVKSTVEGTSNSHQTTHAIVETAFSHSLWDRERQQRGGDSRVELKLAALERWRPVDELRDEDQVQATVSWIRRSSWGIVRIGVGYGW